MNRVKQMFAVIFAIMAVMLMSTAVWAYSGSGTKNDPYLITGLSELKDCFQKDCYIRLKGDITYSDISPLYITGKDVCLDLNGHTIENTQATSSAYTRAYSMLVINGNGKLTLNDSVGNGKLISNQNEGLIYVGYTDSDNTDNKFVLNGGSIINNNTGMEKDANGFFSYAITVYRGDAEINAGTVNSKLSDALYVQNGSAVINGGIFKSDSSDKYGIKIWGNNRVTVNGGKIYKLYIMFSHRLLDDVKIKLNECTIYNRFMCIDSQFSDFLSDIASATIGEEAADTSKSTLNLTSPLVISSPHYDVTFNANGGSGTMEKLSVVSGSEISLPECKFTAPQSQNYRYTFVKWSVDGIEYNAGEKMTVYSDTTVKAVWEKALLYNISFDAGEGEGTIESLKVCKGDDFIFPECTFTPPENMEFDHWLSLVTGTRSENAEWDKVTFNNDNNTVVSAIWKYKTYTVTFDTGGKCTPPPSQSVTYNEYAVDNGDPVANGYNFAGWYYDSTYTQVFSFYNRITENTTLYAKWDEINSEVSLSYDYSGYDLDNRKKLKVYYGDDLNFTTTETAGTIFGYYMVVNGDTYNLIYSDGYHPFVIDDSTQVMRRIDNDRIYYNAKSFIEPNNTVYIYSMRFVDGRRYFTSVYELDILYRPGDVDGSGKVNDTDAAMLLKHIGGISLLDSEQLKRADLNNDGEIDMLDVIEILNN